MSVRPIDLNDLKKLDFSKLASKNIPFNAILNTLEGSTTRENDYKSPYLKTSANSPRALQTPQEGHTRTKSMGLLFQPYNTYRQSLVPNSQEVVEISRPQSREKRTPSQVSKYFSPTSDEIYRSSATSRAVLVGSRGQQRSKHVRPSSISTSRILGSNEQKVSPQFILMNFETTYDLYRTESSPERNGTKLLLSAKGRNRSDSNSNAKTSDVTPGLDLGLVRSLPSRSTEVKLTEKSVKKHVNLFLAPGKVMKTAPTSTSLRKREPSITLQRSPTIDYKLGLKPENSPKISPKVEKEENKLFRKTVRGVELSKASEYSLHDRQKAMDSIVNNKKNLRLKLDLQSVKCFQELKESIGMNSAERPYTSMYQNFMVRKSTGVLRQNMYLIKDICKDVGVLKKAK